MRILTTQQLLAFKRDAKRRKRREGCTHIQALDAEARANGYKNYHELHLRYKRFNEET